MDKKVIQFLSRHNPLLPYLLEVFRQIDKYFPNAPLEICVFDNYETNPHLRIEIIMNADMSPEEALEIFNEFRYGWWLDHIEELISIDINWR
jgi:hypothetical protein